MGSEIDLTNFRDLVRAERDAEALRRHHLAEADAAARVRDQIRFALGKVFGDAEDGILDGRVVLRRRVTSQFATARFAKDHPDLAKQFEQPKVTYHLDTEALQKAEPDLYGQYVTIRWYSDSED